MNGISPYLVPFFRRFVFLFIISTVVILLISEISYRLLRDDSSRNPTTIELVIPKGTAEGISQGKPSTAIPEEMVFVVGDVLVVINEDKVDHELGPLWVPAGKSASLTLDQANDYTYSCSFRVSNYLDLTVRSAITWRDRLGAMLYGVPPTLMFLLVYSFVFRPLRPARSVSIQSDMPVK